MRKRLRYKWQEGDDEILKNGTVDYIGFSYYMSTVIKHDAEQSVDGNVVNGGLPNSVENPYIKSQSMGLGNRSNWFKIYFKCAVQSLSVTIIYR